MNKRWYLIALTVVLFAFSAATACFAVDETIIAKVGENKEVTADEFVQTAKFFRFQNISYYYQMVQMYSQYGIPIDDLNSQLETYLGEDGKVEIGQQALDQVIYEKMLDLEANEKGLSFTPEEITAHLKEMFGYTDPEPEDTSMGGLDESSVVAPEIGTEEDAFETFLENSAATNYEGMLTPDFFRALSYHDLLDSTMFGEVSAGHDFKEEMVKAQHILVEEEATAKEILEKLDAGEDWNALAAEYSIDTSNKDDGGDLGWVARGSMVLPFEEAAFALEPGETTKEPVKTDYGFHIIRSEGKEVRELEDDALSVAQQALYSEWQDELKAKYTQETYDNWQDLIPLEPAFEPVILPTAVPTEEGTGEEPVTETEATPAG